MRTFGINKSKYVRAATITAFVIAGLILAVVLTDIDKLGRVPGISLVLLIGFFLVYFYSKSLKQVELGDEGIILKHPAEEKIIPYDKIAEIGRAQLPNLAVTTGSFGVFGLIGSRLDDNYTNVNNRAEMIRVRTAERRYLFSCELPDELISEVRKRMPKSEAQINVPEDQ